MDKTDIIPVDTVIKVTVNAKAGSGYTGSASGEYKITTGSITSAKVVIPVQTYTGKPIELKKSDITVSIKGATLSEADYDIVSYTDNTQKGTAGHWYRVLLTHMQSQLINRSLSFTAQFII